MQIPSYSLNLWPHALAKTVANFSSFFWLHREKKGFVRGKKRPKDQGAANRKLKARNSIILGVLLFSFA
jgi:hypothetical protein